MSDFKFVYLMRHFKFVYLYLAVIYIYKYKIMANEVFSMCVIYNKLCFYYIHQGNNKTSYNLEVIGGLGNNHR